MAKGRKTGGRKKGTPNKRLDLQEFLTAVFERVDPVKVAEKLLKANGPGERVLIRLLEYRYGRPPQGVEESDGGTATLTVDVSAIPRHP